MTPHDLKDSKMLIAKADKIIVQPERFIRPNEYFTYMRIVNGWHENFPHSVVVVFSKDKEKWGELCPRSVAWVLENYEMEPLAPRAIRNRLSEVDE